MKINSKIKSALIFIVLTGILFFFQEDTRQSSFSWFEDLDELTSLQIVKSILSHIVVTFPMAIAFSCPFLFYKKIEFKKFLFFTAAINIFLVVFLLMIANNDYVKLVESSFGEIALLLFVVVLFPTGIFFITKFFKKIRWVLFVLILVSGPFSIFLGEMIDSLIPRRYLINSFYLFFSLMISLFFSSILYCKRFDNLHSSLSQNDDILDSPIDDF